MKTKGTEWDDADGALAALAEEARELGALAGLTGSSLNAREAFRPRLLSLATKLYGPSRASLQALEERLGELDESRRGAEEQVAAYLSGAGSAECSPLPGWRRAFTVLGLAGLTACGLSSLGLATRTWLGAVACLTLVAMVNAAGVEQAARGFRRWLDYRRARRRRGRLHREMAKLRQMRFEERDRQLQIEMWTEEKLAWLEARYEMAFKLAQAARGAPRAAAA